MAETRAIGEAIPGRGDPDRKRALNVLAQRRYRQRRREKIQALETRVQSTTAATLPAPVPQSLSPVCQLDSMQNKEISTPGWSDMFFNQDESSNMRTHSPTDQSEEPAFDLDAIFDSFELPVASNFEISLFSPPINLEAELQNLETSQFTFPDDDSLEIPELRTMKAGFKIAELIGCVESIWDLTSRRVFDKHSIPATTHYIPPNLMPTEAQRQLPHHALFDIFPWPSVRNKLIVVFSQPEQFRPPSARDPMAMMNLMSDMEDSAEGLRISGNDWYDEKNWEIGQLVFKNWWFIFDREVVHNSNTLRQKRGASKLILTS